MRNFWVYAPKSNGVIRKYIVENETFEYLIKDFIDEIYQYYLLYIYTSNMCKIQRLFIVNLDPGTWCCWELEVPSPSGNTLKW